MGKTLSLIFLLTFLGRSVNAQCGEDPPWREDGQDGKGWDFGREPNPGFSIGRALGNFLTPPIIRETNEIRKYVRDTRFVAMRRQCGDLDAIDAIYRRAFRIAEYDVGRALFLSMMASLEHQNVDIKVPVLGKIGLPLTFEEDSLFKSRINNLPTQIYTDSPRTREGDRDKLQHFFGSAYLTFASESPGLARSTGNLIEWGEAKFVVGGADDPRDRRANKQGELFGHQLIFSRNLLPSEFLQLPVKVDTE